MVETLQLFFCFLMNIFSECHWNTGTFMSLSQSRLKSVSSEFWAFRSFLQTKQKWCFSPHNVKMLRWSKMCSCAPVMRWIWMTDGKAYGNDNGRSCSSSETGELSFTSGPSQCRTRKYHAVNERDDQTLASCDGLKLAVLNDRLFSGRFAYIRDRSLVGAHSCM